MAKFSSELLNQLSEFLVCEIGGKAIDGITYTMLLKDNAKDKEAYKRYMDIKQEILKCGYSADEIFRVYEVNNGYIFDLDLKTAKQITYQLSKAVAKQNGGESPVGDLIGDRPEQRRKRDMVALARYIKECYDKGETEVQVALFSKNSTNKIMVTGIGSDGSKIAVTYKAFAIRHWDIEKLNSQLLMHAGIKVYSIQPCEILPYKTGVSFTFRIGPYEH